ncbi:MAG: hypothetical protein ACW99U_03960 [Candidatus Thorarchaeota archaeon]|jgi:hypothetical protein
MLETRIEQMSQVAVVPSLILVIVVYAFVRQWKTDRPKLSLGAGSVLLILSSALTIDTTFRLLNSTLHIVTDALVFFLLVAPFFGVSVIMLVDLLAQFRIFWLAGRVSKAWPQMDE